MKLITILAILAIMLLSACSGEPAHDETNADGHHADDAYVDHAESEQHEDEPQDELSEEIDSGLLDESDDVDLGELI